jgi:hypothetical protein
MMMMDVALVVYSSNLRLVLINHSFAFIFYFPGPSKRPSVLSDRLNHGTTVPSTTY